MSDLIFFEVDINHPCWFVDTTEHNPDARLKELRVVKIKGDSITNLAELTSPNPKKDIDFIRKHKLVKRVEVVMLNIDSAILRVTSSYKAMTYKILHESKVVELETPITEGGVDKEILMAKNYKDLDRLIKGWKEEGWDVRLRRKKYVKKEDLKALDSFKSSGFFDLNSAKELLTKKQIEVFSKACDWGYYEIPKKITIEELSVKLGISPPTMAEHLRKAEAKLMPILLKVLRKL